MSLYDIDFYKVGHKAQYEEGTQYVYCNFTARSATHSPVPLDHTNPSVVFVGLQGALQRIEESWENTFFAQPKAKVLREYKRRLDLALGANAVDISHIGELWEMGYLPIKVKALPEGSLVPIKVPMFTVINTDPRFYWLPTYLETQISSEVWKPITTATIAYAYRKLLRTYAGITGAPMDFTLWQGHDFSARGMSGMADAAASGIGHLASFLGTDTVASLEYLEKYYDGDQTFLGGSVPATEHSVMCVSGKESEIDLFHRLITKVYPTGIVSIVSDSWDYWRVITEYAQKLADVIRKRKPDALGNAKVVFRPDSGDPVRIIVGAPSRCQFSSLADAYNQGHTVIEHEGDYFSIQRSDDGNGYTYSTTPINNPTPEMKGSVRCLYEIFGGVRTDKGFIGPPSCVGLIYGDSITYDRANAILGGLASKGFASNWVVFGIGSYTYQHVTRDTFGMAYKATWAKVSDVGLNIQKDPATDNGTKKSATGLLRVALEDGKYVLYDKQDHVGEQVGELKTVFQDGHLVGYLASWSEIRNRLWSY